MKTLLRYIFILSCALAIGQLFTGASVADDPSIMVIANETGAPGSLTFKELKAILEGEKQRWSDGTKISIAFMKASTPVGNATAGKVMNMSGDQLNKFWLALVFQGKAKAPVFFNTASDLENYLSQTPGAIGVVDAAYQPKLTKTISVDGKKSF